MSVEPEVRVRILKRQIAYLQEMSHFEGFKVLGRSYGPHYDKSKDQFYVVRAALCDIEVAKLQAEIAVLEEMLGCPVK